MQSIAYKRRQQNIQNEIDADKYRNRELNLFNEKTFYSTFISDMLNAEKEVIIYCPFISKYRQEYFSNTLKKLRRKNIPVFIFTRPLEEHEYLLRSEISCALKGYEEMGVDIFYLSGSIHEKVAIIDRNILWEGSLNILSQRSSREMMHRIQDEKHANEVMLYLGINKQLAEGYKNKYERLYKNLVYNDRENRKEKVVIFFTGVIIPMVIWILSAIPKIIVLILKIVKVVIDLVRLIV
jgi:phosphatidylserine/phosphatidylglycerophosphate/cardiolipin synthase-like enzyme